MGLEACQLTKDLGQDNYTISRSKHNGGSNTSVELKLSIVSSRVALKEYELVNEPQHLHDWPASVEPPSDDKRKPRSVAPHPAPLRLALCISAFTSGCICNISHNLVSQLLPKIQNQRLRHQHGALDKCREYL